MNKEKYHKVCIAKQVEAFTVLNKIIDLGIKVEHKKI